MYSRKEVHCICKQNNNNSIGCKNDFKIRMLKNQNYWIKIKYINDWFGR